MYRQISEPARPIWHVAATPKHKTARFFVLRWLGDGVAHWSRDIYLAWRSGGGDIRTLKRARTRMALRGELTIEAPVYDLAHAKYKYGIKGISGLPRCRGKTAGLLWPGAQRRQWQLTDKGLSAYRQMAARYGAGFATQASGVGGTSSQRGSHLAPPSGAPLDIFRGTRQVSSAHKQNGSHPRPMPAKKTTTRQNSGGYVAHGASLSEAEWQRRLDALNYLP